jgi:hypothetical protein
MLPAPDRTGINMNEIGAGIVADAAASQKEGRFLEAGKLHTRDADIEGAPLQMETFVGNPAPLALQQSIVAGRAISRDDVNIVAAAELLIEKGEIVKGTGVDRMNFVGVVAPQQVVKITEGGRIVSTVGGTVGNFETLAGVSVEEGKGGRECQAGRSSPAQSGTQQSKRRCEKRDLEKVAAAAGNRKKHLIIL